MLIRKPLLIVTGFLGAGKTTLVRTLLSALVGEGLKGNVILNDIESANLDAATIANAENVTPIAASCACCESLGELASACEGALQGEGDLLLIELNGTADPLELLGAITLVEDRLPFSPKLLVCVIDIRNWGKRGNLTPLEKRQMEGAGLYILSHTERAKRVDIDQIRISISDEFPNSRPITTRQLIDLLTRKSPQTATNNNEFRAPRKPIGEREHDEIHLLSHQIEGCLIPLPPKVRRASIERLIHLLPDEVLRAKALIRIVEHPGMRWLFERSGAEVFSSPIPVSDISAPSSLLCTGIRLDRDALDRLVFKTFGYFPAPRTKNAQYSLGETIQ